MVKVGLVTGPSMPKARQAPRTKVVLPLPSSPETVTTSPTRRVLASRAATASVSAGEAECSSTELRRGRAERPARGPAALALEPEPAPAPRPCGRAAPAAAQ